MLGARGWGLWVLVGWMLGCGGTSPRGAEVPAGPDAERAGSGGVARASSAETDASTLAEVTPADGPREARQSSGGRDPALPTECHGNGELCLPPPAFVKKLCQDAYSGAALRLFDKSSPFSRGYVRSREVKAVNTLGGPSSDQSLRFEEEVLILSHSGGPGAHELQVSGMGGYAVLRWDGTCATLAEEELGTRAPRSPRHAAVAWKYIDTNIQTALLRDASIEAARRQHRKHCHGVSLGRLSAACAAAEADLSESIVTAVRAGLDLPTPDRMP